ncbi:MAG TPA: nuclear transport factor 2 family protein [Acidimicrobiia bacterium]|jgi:hypothetical protein
MTTVMSDSQADAFVASWMEAWNAHDTERIVAHYRDDVEYHSPFVARLAGGDGVLHGLGAVRAYVAAGLGRYPDLHFDPPSTIAVGAGSVAIVYRSVDDLVAVETLVLDDDGLVVRAHCHYARA